MLEDEAWSTPVPPYEGLNGVVRLKVPLERLSGALTVVIGSVSASEPLDRVSPEPIAVMGSANVRVPLDTDRPVPKPVTCVVVQPCEVVVTRVPEVGKVRVVLPVTVSVVA